MKVSDAMSRDLCIASPDDSIAAAAREMAAIDAGSLPVAENQHLVGMVTDRDITVRAVAERKGVDTPIRDVMSKEVRFCYEDDDLDRVAADMAAIRVRRLPVVSRDKRLVGILSLGDIALAHGADTAGEAIAGISRPGGPHSQKQTH